jgi:acyl carrier protein
MDPVYSQLTRCFAAVFPDLPATEISSASLGSVPNWDSLATINLVALIEEEFQIQTEPEDLARLVSFNSILDYVNERVASQGSPDAS